MRTSGEALRRSTVAHFARKVRGTNIMAAKHKLKTQQSHGPTRWPCSLHVRAPHFASKVSYSAGAATDDCASTNLHCKGAGVQNQEKSLCGFEPNDMAVAPLPLKGAHIPG